MIVVKHGTLTDLHCLRDSTWLFYVAPMYPGILTISAPAGAFVDDEGRVSVASDSLEVVVPSTPNMCLFLSQKQLVNELLIVVYIVCESPITPKIQDFSVSNSTVVSLTEDESTNSLILSLTTSLVRTTIRVDFSHTFKSINSITSDELIIQYTTSYSFPLSLTTSSTCSMTSAVLLMSSVVVYEVKLICDGVVIYLFPSWVNAPNSLLVIPIETSYSSNTQFVVAVIAPYDTEIVVQPPVGSLLASNLYIENLPSIILHAETKRPLPQISVMATESPFEYRVRVSFTEMMRGMDSSSLLSWRTDGIHATVSLSMHSSVHSVFDVSFAESGAMWVYVKGGAAISEQDQPCLGSQAFKIVATEPRFSFVSTFDEEDIVYTNDVCGRLQAPSLVTELHSDDVHTSMCSLAKFVVGSVGTQTVVDMCLNVNEEGVFEFWIEEGVVTLLNGTMNNRWYVKLKWIRGLNRMMN